MVGRTTIEMSELESWKLDELQEGGPGSGRWEFEGRGARVDAREPLADLVDAVVHKEEGLLDAGRRQRLEGPGEEGDVEKREEALRAPVGRVSGALLEAR